jgi:4-amino-4-deoxy-L-arabinose transferase-like glycosyltransferase
MPPASDAAPVGAAQPRTAPRARARLGPRALTAPSTTRIATRLALPAILAVGALLRLATLGSQSLWLDEATTHQIVDHPLRAVLRLVPADESTPALYYVAAWAWTRVAGVGDVGLRSLSAACGIAFVLVAYVFGRRLAGRACGLALAAITAVHPLLIWYSQEARSYALATLLAGLGWLAFLGVLDRPSPRTVAWWAAATAAAASTHYSTVAFALVQGLWLLRARPAARRPLVAAAGALALLALALAPTAAMQNDGRTAWIKAIPLGDRLEDAVREFLAGTAWPTWHPALWTGIVAAVAVGLALTRRDLRRVGTPALVALLGIVATLVLRETGPDLVLGRNLMFGWLPLAAVAAAGLTALPRPWLCAAAVVAACVPLVAVTIGFQRDDRLQRPDWAAVARAVGPTGQTRIVIGPGGWVARPLGVYLKARELPVWEPVRTRELVVVGAATEGFARRCDNGLLCGMAPSRPGPSPLPGLTKVSEHGAAGGRFVVARYVSQAPFTLSPELLPAFGVATPGQPVMLFRQAPG